MYLEFSPFFFLKSVFLLSLLWYKFVFFKDTVLIKKLV